MIRALLRRSVPVSAALLLAGCVRVGAPPPLATPVPDAFDGAAARAGADAAAIDLDRWWTQFRDPQLTALIEEGVRRSPDVQAVEARVAEADATMSRALRRFDPQGGLSSSASVRDLRQLAGDVNLPNLPVDVPLVQVGRTQIYDAAFNVSWEVDLFGRKRATAVVAGAQVRQAAVQAQAARASLAAAIADGLFAARGLAAELAFARDALANEQAAAVLVDRRIASGLLPGSEALPARNRRRVADLRVDALATELDAARRNLLVLVGRGTAPLAEMPVAATLATLPAVPQATPGALLARRPDVIGAHSAVVAALGGRALAKLDLFPSFVLSPGVGIERAIPPNNSFTTSFWSLGLGLVMPILDRGRLMAELRASDARVVRAVAEYERAVQTAYAEAETVLARLVSDHRQLGGIAASHQDAGRYLATIARGQAAGLLDRDAAIAARRQAQAADIDLTRARTQVLRRSVQAFKALGGGWDAPTPCQGQDCTS